MLLVPRQLQRSGMTGTVPYYGGRFTPAQAWAASHPAGAPRAAPAPPTESAPPAENAPQAESAPPTESAPQAATRAALDHLRRSGVLTPGEHDELLRRIGS